jgi:hypothetical protein
MFVLLVIFTVTFTVTIDASSWPPQMPAGMTHEEHMKQLEKENELKKRGAAAMGFDQDTTRHAFTIESDGGSIAVDVKDAADVATRDEVRAHLKEIAGSFAKGDFSKPFQTHGEVPPGVRVMIEKKDAIAYTYAETPLGAIVRIRTRDSQALDAIHVFLAYQIGEHRNP